MGERKPRTWFWTTIVALAIVVAYPLSFGSACWATSRLNLNANWVNVPYQPIIRVWARSPEPLRRWIRMFTYLAADPNWAWYEPPVLDRDGFVVRDRDGMPMTYLVWAPSP
jgi:hypothetical protein